MEELTIRLKCPCCRASVYTVVPWPGPNLYFVRVTCTRCEKSLTQVIRNGRQADLEETIWDYVVDPNAEESDLDEPAEDRELTWPERLAEGLFEEGRQPISPEEGAAIVAALESLGHVPTDWELGIG